MLYFENISELTCFLIKYRHRKYRHIVNCPLFHCYSSFLLRLKMTVARESELAVSSLCMTFKESVNP